MDVWRGESYPGELADIMRSGGPASEEERSPVQKFLRDAKVLPHFDLGDELQGFRAAHGDEAAEEAEAAYWAMKEEAK